MLQKLFLAGALTAAPIAMSDTASADHNRCYRGYRAPVVTYRVPSYRSHYRGHHIHRHRGVPAYPYGVGYRSIYRDYPYGVGRYGVGRYGYGYPYSRGTAIGVGGGGISLNFGF